MPDLYIFKAQMGMIDPIALQDHNVCIHYNKSIYYRKVDFLESIPPFQCVDLTAGLGLAAFAPTGRVNIVNLEMADNEFGLFRWYPVDNAQIRLFHPSGIAKFQLRNLQVPVDMNILVRDPNLVSTEIAVWQNNRPSAEAVNGNAVALGAVRLEALGYRFHTMSMGDVEKNIGLTSDEKNVTGRMRSENPQWSSKKDYEMLEIALKEGRLPVTHVWCSGRGIGD
jgi:hypothetical protein